MAKAPSTSQRIIKPQPGPQTAFLSSSADIALYGGGAGGGKTWGLLLEPVRHRAVPGFAAAIFRRNLVQVTNPGGLWDQSATLYAPAQGKTRLQPLGWTFPSGAIIRFAHLENEMTVYDWQGTELTLIEFDELTHFSESQFFYMLSRNRSMCGVRPYVRATCNPDADSWVARLIEWFIDQDNGLPIPERSGRLRYFVRVNDALVWADSPEELAEQYPDIPPKSFTFIRATLSDNPALLKADPNYRANLLALPTVERERLLGGNWKIRPAAGLYFQRLWCPVVDAVPAELDVVRYWDMAATPKTAGNDPDWTVGVKMGRCRDGYFWLLDVVRLRAGPGEVEAALAATAAADGPRVRIGLPQDPGQAGKAQAAYLTRRLAGFSVTTTPETGSKVTRFGPASSQARAGNMRLLRRVAEDEAYISSLEAFPESRHDDDTDATAGAFNLLQAAGMGVFDHYRQKFEERQKKEFPA